MFIIKYLKALLYIFIGLLLTTLIITAFNYFNIFNTTTSKWLKLLLIILSIFAGGYYIGKQSTSKGYLEGLKIAGIVILLFFTIGYLGFEMKFHLKNIIYYLVIVTSSILGSITGINKKLRNKT